MLRAPAHVQRESVMHGARYIQAHMHFSSSSFRSANCAAGRRDEQLLAIAVAQQICLIVILRHACHRAVHCRVGKCQQA